MIDSPRHDLDEVIDRVAAKMVAVPDDAGLLSRTMARLPGRTATPWFLSMRVQVAAAAAVGLVAFLSARPSPDYETMPDPAAKLVVEPVDLTVPTPVPPAPSVPVASHRRPAPTFAKAPVRKPDSRLRQGSGAQARLPEASRDDHERSLRPVDAVDAMELVGILTTSIAVESAAAIEPIVLTQLALDTEGEE